MKFFSSLKKKWSSTKEQGDSAESLACRYLQNQGLLLIQRNFKTEGRGGGEVDLIMTAADGTLVFIEVRARKNMNYGGAAASVSTVKQRRIILAATHYLQSLRVLPACRFDVIGIDGAAIQWLQNAFTAD